MPRGSINSRSRLIHALPPPPSSDAFLPFLSPSLLSHFYPRDFSFFLSERRSPPEFLRLGVYFPPRIFQFRDSFLFLSFLRSFSLSLSFVQFFLLSFSRLTRASRGRGRLVERNVALSAIVDYCSAPSRRLLEENYVFLQLSKQTEVEEKCGRREEGGF